MGDALAIRRKNRKEINTISDKLYIALIDEKLTHVFNTIKGLVFGVQFYNVHLISQNTSEPILGFDVF